jgi:hypothetical protein
VTDDHLSFDELAELDEGLLSSDRITAIREHLDGCGSCRAKADAITASRSALSDLPAVTMPADVRARIDNALAAEAQGAADRAVPPQRAVELSVVEDSDPRVDDGPQLDAGAPTIDPSMRAPDVIPAAGSVVRRRFGRPTMASSAAAAAIVLAVGAVVVAHFHHGSSTPQSSLAAGADSGARTDQNPLISGGPQPSSVVKSATGATYTATNLSTAVSGVLARAAATGPIAPLPSASSSVGSSGGAAGSKPERTTKSDSSGSTAGKATVSPPSESTFAQDSTAPIPKSLRPLFHSNAKIIACAVTITGQHNAVPEHVDFGRWTGGIYHNVPSAIFIFQGTTPASVSVWVTNPTCSGNDIIRTFSQVAISN